MFKIGDIVECIDAPSSFDIQVGEIYTVKQSFPWEDKIRVNEVDGNFYTHRFRLLGESPFIVWERANAMGVQV